MKKNELKEMVLVALHEKHIKEALYDLKEAGFSSLIPVSFDSDLWSDLRAGWMRIDQIDFNQQELEKAVQEYQHRHRRFGGI